MRLNSLPWQRNAYLCSVEVAMLNIGEGGGGGVGGLGGGERYVNKLVRMKLSKVSNIWTV